MYFSTIIYAQYNYLHSNQVFLQDAETLDSVTVSQESFLANEDLGVSTIIIIYNYNNYVFTCL